MLGSNSHFFYQPVEVLSLKRRQVNQLLKLKGYSHHQIAIYIEAFNFFCKNPSQFDGATIAKDLIDIPGLDLDAMLHDYHYLVYNVAASFSMKWKTDWIYAKGQERKGKGLYSAYSRFVVLSIIGIGFVPYIYSKKGRISKSKKEAFLKEYEILINPMP